MAALCQPRHDPNPGFGRVSLLDVVKSLGALASIMVQVLFFLPGQVLSPSKTPFKVFLQRKMLEWLPTSIIRRPAGIDHILKSKRYRQHSAHLTELVDRPDFRGTWLCKPGFDSSAAPSAADVVILFAHGGGYVVGQPGTYTTLFLRVVERLKAQGQTVAIFALDYSLAPEHVFPHQLYQMSACWEYLVGTMGIPPSKLALMGDSAGGSLCLSFLVHMACPMSKVPKVSDSSRPGRGLFLISPWVSLLDESGYKEKESGDVLSIAKLREWAALVTKGADRVDMQKYLHFVGGRDDLANILPHYTWVSAGEKEIFLKNILRFVDDARAAGQKVDVDVKASEVHDWQVMESLEHEGKFLGQEFGTLDDELLTGADAIAMAVAAVGSRNPSP